MNINPIAWWKNQAEKSFLPPADAVTHTITMDVVIEKGQTEGRVVIPADFDAYVQDVDLNPTLVKKVKSIDWENKKLKEKMEEKKIRDFPRDTPVIVHEGEEVRVNSNEEVEYEEMEHCPNCGQKVMVATVSEIRHQRDPVFTIKITDPALETLKIPVKFGFSIGDIRSECILPLLVDAGIVVASPIVMGIFLGLNFPSNLFALVLVSYLLYAISIVNYKFYKFWQWYQSVKHTIQPVVVRR